MSIYVYYTTAEQLKKDKARQRQRDADLAFIKSLRGADLAAQFDLL